MILKIFVVLGVGMDVVFGGEYVCVKVVGVSGEWIVFFGVGKMWDEIYVVLIGGLC